MAILPINIPMTDWVSALILEYPDANIPILSSENNVLCRNSLYPVTDTQQVKVPEFEIPYSLYPGQDEILRPRQKGEKDI